MTNASTPVSIWPRPQEMRATGKTLTFNLPLTLSTLGAAPWLSGAAVQVVEVLNRATGREVVKASGASEGHKLTVAMMDALPRGAKLKAERKAEGYSLSIDKDGILIASDDAAGVYYGAQTLAQVIAAAEPSGGTSLQLPGLSMRDWPRLAIRGAHVFMPPREHLDFFERFLDFMAAHKMNTLMLEIGGGMEYDKHPEINESWRRFIRDAYSFNFERDVHKSSQRGPERRHTPSGPNALAGSRFFSKDSIHPELGGGDCLTKDEVRRIVGWCRDRHIELIPEVQSLTHSYYLCVAHPEIAERAPEDDPWPDIYCISNPQTYELLFDVLDEVIDVTQPRIVHIGHDELENFHECPKCKARPPHELLAEDITKIHDFLAARGIRTLMWSDTLMKFDPVVGYPAGGGQGGQYDAYTNRTWLRPAVWQAVDMVPKDILLCDWFWGVNKQSEEYFHEHGFELIFGNFSPLGFENFEKRTGHEYVHGAEVSSWCEMAPYAFGHDHVNYGVFAAADMTWRGLALPRAEVGAFMARRMTPLADVLAARPRWLVKPERGKAVAVNLRPAALALPDTLAGKLPTDATLNTVLGTGGFKPLVDKSGMLGKAVVLTRLQPEAVALPIGKTAKRLLLLHGTTMKGVFYQPTYGYYHRGPADILRCAVRYVDGYVANVHSVYGDDIGPIDGAWPSTGAGFCHQAVPVPVGPKHTLYAQEWTNRRPDVAIESLTFSLGPDAVDEGAVIVVAVNLVR